MQKILNFIYRKIEDGRLKENRFFMKTFRKDFVKTLRLDMVDILAAQKIQEETFLKFRNCNFGKDVVIIATGPSLNKYKPIENVVNIGVNKAVFYDKVSYDYFFMQDYLVVKDYIEVLAEKKFEKTVKFFGDIPGYTRNGTCTIPESTTLRLGARRYCIFPHWYDFNNNFQKDIAYAPLATAESVVGAAIQFALYTNPKRIYLVGCDCSNGYFDNSAKKLVLNKCLLKSWKELKTFSNIYYPDTEIISVNPVGLKGLFTDLYQEQE